MGTVGRQKWAVAKVQLSSRAGIGNSLPGQEGGQAGWLGSAVSSRRAQSVPETSQEFLAEVHLED